MFGILANQNRRVQVPRSPSLTITNPKSAAVMHCRRSVVFLHTLGGDPTGHCQRQSAILAAARLAILKADEPHLKIHRRIKGLQHLRSAFQALAHPLLYLLQARCSAHHPTKPSPF
ncbi:hypothetical protein [Noviherbaspirillum malthae]|uniref:hypothetical protein n=1 Tax=Noviherbaspirillum malthae TaxID=1260987 RepID=UPI00188EDBCB|nr:hypothetical protein [Noviherbaspirillum malthae]